MRRSADEAWPEGYQAAKIQKLAMQFQADSKQFELKSEIFKGSYFHLPDVGVNCFLNYGRRLPVHLEFFTI